MGGKNYQPPPKEEISLGPTPEMKGTLSEDGEVKLWCSWIKEGAEVMSAIVDALAPPIIVLMSEIQICCVPEKQLDQTVRQTLGLSIKEAAETGGCSAGLRRFTFGMLSKQLKKDVNEHLDGKVLDGKLSEIERQTEISRILRALPETEICEAVNVNGAIDAHTWRILSKYMQGREHVAVKYLSKVRTFAFTYFGRYGVKDRAELEAIGVWALFKNLDRLDPDRNIDSFLRRAVKLEFLSLAASQNCLTRKEWEYLNMYRDCSQELDQMTGVPPSDDEIFQHLSLSPRRQSFLEKVLSNPGRRGKSIVHLDPANIRCLEEDERMEGRRKQQSVDERAQEADVINGLLSVFEQELDGAERQLLVASYLPTLGNDQSRADYVGLKRTTYCSQLKKLRDKIDRRVTELLGGENCVDEFRNTDSLMRISECFSEYQKRDEEQE